MFDAVRNGQAAAFEDPAIEQLQIDLLLHLMKKGNTRAKQDRMNVARPSVTLRISFTSEAAPFCRGFYKPVEPLDPCLFLLGTNDPPVDGLAIGRWLRLKEFPRGFISL